MRDYEVQGIRETDKSFLSIEELNAKFGDLLYLPLLQSDFLLQIVISDTTEKTVIKKVRKSV